MTLHYSAREMTPGGGAISAPMYRLPYKYLMAVLNMEKP